MTELWKVIVSPESGRHSLYSIDRVGEMHVTTRAVTVNLVDPWPTTITVHTPISAAYYGCGRIAACDVGGRSRTRFSSSLLSSKLPIVMLMHVRYDLFTSRLLQAVRMQVQAARCMHMAGKSPNHASDPAGEEQGKKIGRTTARRPSARPNTQRPSDLDRLMHDDGSTRTSPGPVIDQTSTEATREDVGVAV